MDEKLSNEIMKNARKSRDSYTHKRFINVCVYVLTQVKYGRCFGKSIDETR